MEKRKSRLLRMTLRGGEARVFLCDTTQMAQQARDIHNASNTCSAAMGRMLAGDPGDAAALTPNYLRMAQAERTRQNNQDFYLKK